MEKMFGARPKHIEDARKRGDTEFLRRAGKKGGEATARKRRQAALEKEAHEMRRDEETEQMQEERNGDPDD